MGVDVVGKTEGQSTLQHNVSNLPIIRTFSRFFFLFMVGGGGKMGYWKEMYNHLSSNSRCEIAILE